MEIVERGVLSAAVPGTPRAVSTFPAFVVLADGSLLVTYSIGSGKDTDDLTIELRRSTDGGRTWTDPVTPFETTDRRPARGRSRRRRSRSSTATTSSSRRSGSTARRSRASHCSIPRPRAACR